MRARGASAHGPGRPEGERTEKGERNPKLLLPNTERDLEMIMTEKENSESQAWRREERLGTHDTVRKKKTLTMRLDNS